MVDSPRRGGGFVFIRKGNIVMMVASLGFGMGAVPTDELLQITRSGYEKL